jgi:hypothetical protein
MVIELSELNKDLESIRQLTFDYRANQKECVYVITSNYEKLRFTSMMLQSLKNLICLN